MGGERGAAGQREALEGPLPPRGCVFRWGAFQPAERQSEICYAAARKVLLWHLDL